MYCYNFFNNLFLSDIMFPLELCEIETDKLVSNRIFFRNINTYQINECEYQNNRIGRNLYKIPSGYLIDKGLCKFIINTLDLSIMIIGKMEDINLITIFLLGEVLALFFRIKGLFQLHACMVNKDETTIVICASSGNGKSTLAYEFLMSGWKVLCDDHSLISISNETVYGFPSFPYMKMIFNSSKNKNIDLIFEIPNTGKGFYKICKNFKQNIYTNNYKLSCLIFLNFNKNSRKKMTITDLDDFSSFEKLTYNSYTNLRSNGDLFLFNKDLEYISLLRKLSKLLPHYELSFSKANTPYEVMQRITRLAENKHIDSF